MSKYLNKFKNFVKICCFFKIYDIIIKIIKGRYNK